MTSKPLEEIKFNCPHIESCNGCSFKSLDYNFQRQTKKERFEKALLESLHYTGSIQLEFPTLGYHRDRADFVSFSGKLGLFNKAKEFQELKTCSLLSPRLAAYFQKLQLYSFPINKGSLRLRVSAAAANFNYGLWLDFANQDIKKLLEEKKTLQKLIQEGIFIEIGQKGKKLLLDSDTGTLKLKDPEPHFWFSGLKENQETPLYSLVSSFTQPSMKLNILMQRLIVSLLSQRQYEFGVEFGSGIGNFSALIQEHSKFSFFLENDPRNLLALSKNIKSDKGRIITSQKEWNKELNDKGENFFKASKLFLVNPPKSGVGELFNKDPNCETLIYISCYLDSMVKDLLSLKKYGYKIRQTILFDQFPQSQHFETITKLER